ncbi:hypothetical protein BDV27DRAFT_153264 [Aspergillus caelatus]|uniref:Uncharacterized protein n=1 Tax=Aspergillus caelatus TaxID=61420 RepID=A0A5N7AJ37_9EURO|nr:uncharacterized protein BDV27DRAFT_153264 [Aspergillus caelatus]KAE8369188.1 hypothetical protein BDV27DRAFT_153264 [Aspergillus caelatus]
MAQSPNPKAPPGFKFLEVIIPLHAEAETSAGDLIRIREHLITQKTLIQQTSPNNPSSYDLTFSVCEDMEGEDPVLGGEYSKENALKMIRMMRSREEQQVMYANFTILVRQHVRSDWDGQTPYPAAPENGPEHLRFGNLYFNYDFVVCYNAVVSMVEHLIAKEKKERDAAKHGVQDTGIHHPTLKRNHNEDDLKHAHSV